MLLIIHGGVIVVSMSALKPFLPSILGFASRPSRKPFQCILHVGCLWKSCLGGGGGGGNELTGR